MLREIRCNLFHQQSIQFHYGLNVVVGDEKAANSIGKSMALKVIDFAFGGSDYVNEDVKDNVGDHSIQFCFDFDGKQYYFSRGIGLPSTVFVCDAEYKAIKGLDIDDYREWLKQQYGCGNLQSMSFRDIVGLYIRIYGKENLNECKPLNVVHRKKDAEAIDSLIKLFDAYDVLAQLKHENDEAAKKKQAISDAAKMDVLTVPTGKRNTKALEKQIEDLERDIESAKIELSLGRVSLTQEQLMAVAELNKELEPLKNILLKKQSRLRRLNRGVEAMKEESRVNIEELRVYFPSINIKRVEDVSAFHQQLSGILAQEINAQIKETKKSIQDIESKIAVLEGKVKAVLDTQADDAIMLTINRMIDEVKRHQQLSTTIGYGQLYEDSNALESRTKEEYEKVKQDVLHEIEQKLNAKMDAYNKLTYTEETNPPVIRLYPKRYTFQCKNDTGTGTNYKGLFFYDLSILSLTRLPILVHDTVLFKNLSDEAVGKIVSFYQQFTGKQVFIAVDKIGQYSQETCDALNGAAVLRLAANGQELFGRSWNKRVQ